MCSASCVERCNDICMSASSSDCTTQCFASFCGCPNATTSERLLADRTVASSAADPQADALRNFFNQSGGSSWFNSVGWLTPKSVCLWHGVGCLKGTTTVVSLNTFNNGARGDFSALIAALDSPALAALEILDFGLNELTGSMTRLASVQYIRGLKQVWLTSCRLSGTLPYDGFANLPHLQELHIGANKLSGAVPTFSSNPLLRNLVLGSNSFVGPLPSFDKLGHLESYNWKAIHSTLSSKTLPIVQASKPFSSVVRNCMEQCLIFATAFDSAKSTCLRTTFLGRFQRFLGCH